MRIYSKPCKKAVLEEEWYMAVIFINKMAEALFTILKWMLRVATALLKLMFWMAKLFLLLAVLAVSSVSSIAGVTSGRR